jgi:hypothetical protein
MNAPVCPISRNQALPGMRPRQLVLPPRALDLPSLIAAANALRDLVLGMMGPGAGLNNAIGAGAGFGGLNQGSAGQDPGKMAVVKNDWLEVRRNEERKRIYGKKNKTSYVDVVRINNLVFHWEHNDVFMPEDSFEWAYNPSNSVVNYGA